MRRALLAGAVAASLVPAAQADARDSLVIGIAQFPSTLHPLIDAEIVKGYVLGFANRPITSFDKDWQLACLLCTEVPTVENGLARFEMRPGGDRGLAVTIRLKPDLAWGDGAPVTARDIAFTWKVASDTNVAVSDPHAWANVERVELVDDHTAVLHLRTPVYDYNQWGPLLPEHLEADAYAHASGQDGYAKQTLYARAPATAGLYDGPYVVSEYRSGAQVVLEPNDHWAGPRPGLRRIVIRTIENTAALQANLLSGDVDMAAENIGLTIDQVLALRRQRPDDFAYAFRPSLAYEHVNLNLANPILQDLRVRRALLLAIDRKTLTEKLFEGLQPVAATWINPLAANYARDVASYGYDPARARALLAEAGWRPGPDGTCRDETGRRLSLEFVTTAGNKQRELVQQVLQSQWRAVGIEVTLRNEPARTLFGETLRKRAYTGLAMYAYIDEVDGSPRNSLSSGRVPTAANGYLGGNTTGFSDPAMDADIARFDTELDPGERKRIAGDMQRIYADQLPALPLFFRAEAAVLPKWLHGYALTGHSGYSSRWAEFWRVD